MSTMSFENSSIASTQASFFVMSNPWTLVLLYRYGFGLIFIFGLMGNMASIATFARPTLRATSTGTLFLILAVLDSIFLIVSIFDFVEIGIIQSGIFLSIYDSFCRFRWFTKECVQYCSGWILTLVSIDRWLRTRFPFKANVLCTHRNAAIAVLVFMVIGILMHCHMLSAQLFGGMLPGIATSACGPTKTSGVYRTFFYAQWPMIQVFK
jgi:hypothetical protein